jgi:hypothetical protein
MNRETKKRRAPATGLALSRRAALVAELLASARGGNGVTCDVARCSNNAPCYTEQPPT